MKIMKWCIGLQNLNYISMEFLKEVLRIVLDCILGFVVVVGAGLLILLLTPVWFGLILMCLVLCVKLLFDLIVQWVKNLISRWSHTTQENKN